MSNLLNTGRSPPCFNRLDPCLAATFGAQVWMPGEQTQQPLHLLASCLALVEILKLLVFVGFGRVSTDFFRVPQSNWPPSKVITALQSIVCFPAQKNCAGRARVPWHHGYGTYGCDMRRFVFGATSRAWPNNSERKQQIMTSCGVSVK